MDRHFVTDVVRGQQKLAAPISDQKRGILAPLDDIDQTKLSIGGIDLESGELPGTPQRDEQRSTIFRCRKECRFSGTVDRGTPFQFSRFDISMEQDDLSLLQQTDEYKRICANCGLCNAEGQHTHGQNVQRLYHGFVPRFVSGIGQFHQTATENKANVQNFKADHSPVHPLAPLSDSWKKDVHDCMLALVTNSGR